MTAYYNEHDAYAAQWLRNLIEAGHIAKGEVDERSIVDVPPDDLRGFTQCHFFAGIGGWSLAARLAGWPDDRPLWTGSCPCQPFSVAGKGGAQEDERHLWPVFFDLIRSCRPDVVMGEQVAAAVGKDWLDGVCADLEGIGYATGASVVPACAVDAPHRRDRLWFVAHTGHERCDGIDSLLRRDQAGRGASSVYETTGGGARLMADAGSGRRGGPGEGQDQFARGAEAVRAGDCDVADANEQGSQGREFLPQRGNERSAWSHGVEWAIGADGKARRVKSGLRLLAHGVPGRVGKLRAYGNAIVPQVAAEVIGAFMDTRP